MSFLLDTCVISEVVKPSPNPAVLAWLAAQEEASLFISVLTLGELRRGVERLPASRKREALTAWLESELSARFSGRILSIDEAVAAQWGVMQARAERAGARLPAIDSLIAATAMAHHLTVVSRNIQDMEASGVSLLNPWG